MVGVVKTVALLQTSLDLCKINPTIGAPQLSPHGHGQVQGNGIVTIAGSSHSQHQTIQVLVLDRALAF
jgi:hypothetical protein